MNLNFTQFFNLRLKNNDLKENNKSNSFGFKYLLMMLMALSFVATINAQDCNGVYFTSSTGFNDPTVFTSYTDATDLTSGTIENLTPGADNINGIGYNVQDELIYGIVVSDNDNAGCSRGEIVTINAARNVVCRGIPTSSEIPANRSLPTWQSLNTSIPHVPSIAGDVDDNNHYYTIGRSGTAPFTRFLVDVNLTTMTYTDINIIAPDQISDLAFSSATGYLYSLGAGKILEIDPTIGVISTTSVFGVAGGAWRDVQGNIFFYNNGNGLLYKYNPVTQVFVIESMGGNTGGSFDATACISSEFTKELADPTATYSAGDTVEYVFKVYNGSVAPVSGSSLTDVLPAGLSWVPGSLSPSATGTVSISGQTVTVSNITVPTFSNANGPYTFSLTALIDPNTTGSPCFDNVATFNLGSSIILSTNPTTADPTDPVQFCVTPDPCTDGATAGTVTANDPDADGINIVCDDDDDNDGILDINEYGVGCATNVTVVNFIEDFGTGSTTSTPFTSYTYNPAATGMAPNNLAPDEYVVGANASSYHNAWVDAPDHTGNVDGRMYITNASEIPGDFYSRRIQVTPHVLVNANLWIKNAIFPVDFPDNPNVRVELRDLAGLTIGSVSTGEILEDGDWHNFSIDIDPLTNNEIDIVFINNTPASNGNDILIDDIVVSQQFCDTDNDGIADYLDVDSDGDGCPDAIEGGGAFTSADLTSSDNLADADEGSIDANGVPNIAGSPQATSVAVTTNVTVTTPTVSVSATPILLGGTSTFTASATATEITDFVTNTTANVTSELLYEWFKDGVSLGPATVGDTTYTVSNAVGTDSGTYSVIISHPDRAGCTETASVMLVVNGDPCTDGATLGTITANDSDADGINDTCDLDDDNDGILDTDECDLNNFVTQSFDGPWLGLTDANVAFSLSAGVVPTTDSGVYTINDLGLDVDRVNRFRLPSANAISSYTITISFDNPVPVDEILIITRDPESVPFSQNMTVSGGTATTASFHSSSVNAYPNLNYNPATGDFSLVNPTISHTNALYGTDDSTVMSITISGTKNVGDSMNIYVFSFRECDTDGDGIPNGLDLDSDGDGCPDALEGDGSFDTDDLGTSNMPGGNSGPNYTGPSSDTVQDNLGITVDNSNSASISYGVPIVSPASTAITQGIGFSQDGLDTTSCCPLTEDTLTSAFVNEQTCTPANDASITLSNGGITASTSYDVTYTLDGGTPTTVTILSSIGSEVIIPNLGDGTYTDINIALTSDTNCNATLGGTATPTEITIAPYDVSSLNVSTSVTNVTTLGGTDGIIAATVTGGSGTYTYSWDRTLPTPLTGFATGSSATGLVAGTYRVTVTDTVTGCEVIESPIVVGSGADPCDDPANVGVVTASGSHQTSVNGTEGTLTATISGNTDTYNYVWDRTQPTSSPGIYNTQSVTNVMPGTYVVTATNTVTGCVTATDSFIVLSFGCGTAISFATPTLTDVTCFNAADGQATIDVTAANGPLVAILALGTTTIATDNLADDTTDLMYSNLDIGSYTVTLSDDNGCEGSVNFTIEQPTQLAATASTNSHQTTAGGTEGEVTVMVTGGTPDYSYLWMPGGSTDQTPTGLLPGNYEVTVTDDNGCTTTATTTVNAFGCVLDLSISAPDVLCNGGTVTAVATATNTSGTVTYDWTNTDTSANVGNTANVSLPAGNYTVVISDDTNCDSTGTITITEPDALSLAMDLNMVRCYNGMDGSIDLTVSGGTPNYSYTWRKDGTPISDTTQDISGLGAGLYEVTVTDANGCMEVFSDTITHPAELVVTIASTVNTGCDNEAIITANMPTGGTPDYSYVWTDASNAVIGDTDSNPLTIDVTGLGDYTLTVTDLNNCTTTATTTVMAYDDSAFMTTASVLNHETAVNANDGKITTSTPATGSGTYTYVWDQTLPSPITGIYNLQQSPINVAPGTYVVTVTDTVTGCTTTDTVTVDPYDCSLAAPVISGDDMVCHSSVLQLMATGTGDFTWSSSDTTVATIDNSGVVTAIGTTGTTDITVTVTDTAAGCTSPSSAVFTVTINETDTDGDGLIDCDENPGEETDPCVGYDLSNVDLTDTTSVWAMADCDGDGTTNIDEVDPDGDGTAGPNGTDPFDPCEDDGIVGDEDLANPIFANEDCDGDGVTNGNEIDPDNDGVPNTDGTETDWNDPCDFNPADISLPQTGDYLAADCDGDGEPNNDDDEPFDPCVDYDINNVDLTDTTSLWAMADCDGDGTTNIDEVDPDGDGIAGPNGTDPFDPCVDDGIVGDEDLANPIFANEDCDGDGVTNGDEIDPDGDGVPNTDGTETDFNDPCDFNPADITLEPRGTYLTADCDGDGEPNSDDEEPFDPCVDYDISNVDLNNTTSLWAMADCDGDGTTNIDEVDPDGDGIAGPNGTDPFDSCVDDGTIGDEDLTNPIFANADCDGDGVTNGDEIDPDGDGTPGPNETDWNNPCEFDATDVTLPQIGDYLAADCDGDGTLNVDDPEPFDPCVGFTEGSEDAANPIWADADCDGDGTPNDEDDAPYDPCTDYTEANADLSNPIFANADCDGDGVTNGDEIDPDGDGTPGPNGTEFDNPCDFDATDVTITQTGDYLAADCDGDGTLNVDDPEPFDPCVGFTEGSEDAANPIWADADCDGDGTPNDEDDAPYDPCTDYTEANADLSNPIFANADCDGDGVTNGDEIDPDGDGTPGPNGTEFDNPCDFDATNVTITQTGDYLAADCDGDGTLNVDDPEPFDPCVGFTEGSEDAANPIWADADCDGDGTPNDEDDAPYDPCTDYTEANADLSNPIFANADCDGDGVTNGDEIDPDGDGTPGPNGTEFDNPCDYTEADITLPQLGDWNIADCDGDGTLNVDDPEPLDPCIGFTEGSEDAANPIWANADCDGDGNPNGTDTEPYDPCEDYIVANIDLTITDSDWALADCDGDGVTNIDEVDPDGDGIQGPNDTDIDDPCDFDATDITLPQVGDYLATDCDGDGTLNGDDDEPFNPCVDYDISMADLTNPIFTQTDCDGDGVTNGDEVDPDGDGTPGPNGTDPNNPCDFNTTDITLGQSTDWLGGDCDDDGVTNGDELGPDPLNPMDTDGDGISDFEDVDDDNDGIITSNEDQGDTDGDNYPDYLDQDSDDDGIPDNVEGQSTEDYIPPTGMDTDGDGLDDAYDTDSGNDDGINPEDTDGDGEPDFVDEDSDNDGVPDATEAFDSDNDGEPDTVPSGDDENMNGIDDAFEDVVIVPGTPDFSDPNGAIVGGAEGTDNTDGDEQVDFRDEDDDNDGIPTAEESIDGDCDFDGVVDYQDPDPCDLIPNGFTPNGDGENDLFIIPAVTYAPNFKIEIYNRWGNIVYDYSNKGRTGDDILWWDGYSNGRWTLQGGEKVPVGTYFFVLTFNDDFPANSGRENRKPVQGWVYLAY